MNDRISRMSRREALAALGVGAAATFAPGWSFAQSSSAQLPLKTTGLEHMGTVVPDVAAAGRFYGRVFNPELHKEKEDPLRYYVTLGVGGKTLRFRDLIGLGIELAS